MSFCQVLAFYAENDVFFSFLESLKTYYLLLNSFWAQSLKLKQMSWPRDEGRTRKGKLIYMGLYSIFLLQDHILSLVRSKI